MISTKVFLALTAVLCVSVVLGAQGCTLDDRGTALFGPCDCDAGAPEGECADQCQTGGAAGAGGTVADGGGGTGGDAGGTGGVGGTGGEGGNPCVPELEVCDNVDNDCDADTPDGQDDPNLGAACDTGEDGICADGTFSCEGGGLVCNQTLQPVTEVCGNSLDDDCDGTTDCTPATFGGDPSAGCRKIATFVYDALAPAGNRYTIVPLYTYGDTDCDKVEYVTQVADGYVQYHRDDDIQFSLDTVQNIVSVKFRCSAGNANITQTAMDTDIEAEGFNENPVVSCVLSNCTYTKPSQCNGGESIVARVEYGP